MIRVAVSTGVRMCSHSAETTRPKAKPVTPAISAPAKVARRKIPMSRSDSMCSLPKQSEQRLHGIAHLTGRLRRPRQDVYREPGKPNSRLLRPGELTVHLGCRRHVGGVGGFRRRETTEIVHSASVANKTTPPPRLVAIDHALVAGGVVPGQAPVRVVL